MQKNSAKQMMLFNGSSQSPKSSAPQTQSSSNNVGGMNDMYQACLQSKQMSSPMQITCDLSDSDPILSNNIHKPKYEVYMRCVTWGRDSHGLFDYESRQIAKRNIKTYTGGKIIRLNNDVEFISKFQHASDFEPSAKPLIIVHEKQGRFMVENDTLVSNILSSNIEPKTTTDEDVNNKMFIVVRNLKNSEAKHDYRLKKGDIIKLGRIKFKVKDYRSDNTPSNGDQCKSNPNYSPVKKPCSNQIEDDYWVGGDDFSEEAIEIDCGVVDPSQSSDIQCKVCWSNDHCPANPLLNSCKCDGSVRYIHYDCLKHWLKQKMNVKEEDNLISYSWKQFECEICKKPYPYVFKSSGRKYRLVDVELPETRNFLWLESLTFEKNSSRMVHIIMPDSKMSSFKLGRGHESDVRVSDISVSRCHAILKYFPEDHSYYLEDNLSKFGTLVLAKQAIELDLDQTKAVQIGRSVISFTVKPSQSNAIKASSPSRVDQFSTQKYSVEEQLRIKIEETNQKIKRIMNASVQPCQQRPDNEASSAQQNAQLNSYLQYLQRPQNNDDRSSSDGISRQIQQFEELIKGAEQRIAQRTNDQMIFLSPQRSSELPVSLSNNYQLSQEDDEAILLTSYKPHSSLLNPEIEQHQRKSKIQSSTADKPSISFQQLKSKYGQSHQPDFSYAMHEEMKEEYSFDHNNIPEEHCEDPPLRIRSKKLEIGSSAKVAEIDLIDLVHSKMEDDSNRMQPNQQKFQGSFHQFQSSSAQVYKQISPKGKDFQRASNFSTEKLTKDLMMTASHSKTQSNGFSIPSKNRYISPEKKESTRLTSKRQFADQKDEVFKRTSSQSPWRITSEAPQKNAARDTYYNQSSNKTQNLTSYKKNRTLAPPQDIGKAQSPTKQGGFSGSNFSSGVKQSQIKGRDSNIGKKVVSQQLQPSSPTKRRKTTGQAMNSGPSAPNGHIQRQQTQEKQTTFRF